MTRKDTLALIRLQTLQNLARVVKLRRENRRLHQTIRECQELVKLLRGLAIPTTLVQCDGCKKLYRDRYIRRGQCIDCLDEDRFRLMAEVCALSQSTG